MSILTGILTIVLVLVSLFLILVVLMQRGSANGGLGAAMGGGMAESALGADSANALSKITTKTAIVFFVLVFGLYLARLYIYNHSGEGAGETMPQFDIPAASPSAPIGDALVPAESAADAFAKELEKKAAEAQ